MFQIDEPFCQSFLSRIFNTYLITYIYLVSVECVASFLNICYTLSKSSSISCKSKNILSILSTTELTTVVVSLPSEGYPVLLRNIISPILVAEGYNPQGRVGIGGSFLIILKIHDPPDRIFRAVFIYLCLNTEILHLFNDFYIFGHAYHLYLGVVLFLVSWIGWHAKFMRWGGL